jgi:hypothetical protein
MCGRYALHAHPEVIALQFGLAAAPEVQARYNIAPASQVLVVRAGDTAPQAAVVRWGLVPRWAKDPAIGAKLGNARAETVAEKPSFREAFRRRRCLIPASGFYEWKAEAGRKQPYYVVPATVSCSPSAACGAGAARKASSRPAPSSQPKPTKACRSRSHAGVVSRRNYARWLNCMPGSGCAIYCDPAIPPTS